MPAGRILVEAGVPANKVYFPTSGIISLIYTLENGASSQVAIVGNEGLIGLAVYMGLDRMHCKAEVQAEGRGYKLSSKIMKREFALGGHLQAVALRYGLALLAQTSQNAVCNQHHSTEQKVCRWLLMNMDRLGERKLIVTQALLAKFIGVSREAINLVAQQLMLNGIILYARGKITILNRSALEQHACECYRALEQEYQRLLPD